MKPNKNQNVFTWTKHDIISELEPWNKIIGPKQERSPVETFCLFLDDEVINVLVAFTNVYATTHNRDSDVIVDEMQCFIAILILSGYNSVPRREMYWETSLDTNNTLVCNAMSRNRFRHIMQNIHCCDNANLKPEDKFAKLRPVIDLLNK